ncbi:MAG: FAD-dependent oxidoreductase [Halobacteria archaeon]|nr:FAD-dependent oxidoreductase [Halobacteria archaeon]
MTEYVIIGDGIAGATAAETLRDELGPDEAEITVITDEAEPLYNRINIKEYAKGNMPEDLIKMHDKGWYDERDIELMLDTMVWEVDGDEKTVHLHNGDEISYDKLLAATGGNPRSLPVPHSDADGIHNFWTFIDSRRIRRDAEEAEDGIVVGAGLLGIDFSYALGKNDVDGKYLMRGDMWWRYAMEETGAEIIHDELRSVGVEPVFGEGVARFNVNRMGHVTECVGTTGEVYDCDMAGVCIGLDLNTEVVENTDARTDEGIVVDEYLRTDDPDIYAAGDIAQFHDVIVGERNINGSWDSAKKQGEVAAKNMMNPDDPTTFEIVPKYSVSHFSMPFMSLGSPTKGEEYVHTTYGDKEYRRLAFKNGRLVGAVLIGNVRPVGSLTRLMKQQPRGEPGDLYDKREQLLEETVDTEGLLG